MRVFVESIKKALNQAAAVFLTPLRMSRLTARIMAIMVFPLSIFLVGLLSIDQYRTTLIQSEFIALERQGFTLARSLALAEADRDQQFARRRLSAETMTHLLPLVGLGSSLRARVFQPNGLLLADTARQGRLRIPVDVKRREDRSWLGHTRDHLNDAMNKASSFFSFADDLPIYVERRRQRADHFPEVLAALSGEPRRALRKDSGGELVLSVAVPIQDLRLVRGALLVSISGGKIERELANVNIAFLQLFLIVLMVTIGLSLYLARSITRPISRLASAADQLRRSGDMSRRLQQLPHRNDEIGHLSDALLAMTDELQRRIQATAAFAADVAHEIKNPLSSLRSAAETISLIKDPAQQQKLMNVILQDVSRLDRLITDISQASRVDTEIIGQDGEKLILPPCWIILFSCADKALPITSLFWSNRNNQSWWLDRMGGLCRCLIIFSAMPCLSAQKVPKSFLILVPRLRQHRLFCKSLTRGRASLKTDWKRCFIGFIQNGQKANLSAIIQVWGYQLLNRLLRAMMAVLSQATVIQVALVLP